MHLNASQAAMSELTLRETDITCVQVLLGMIIVFQGTSNSRPATVLIPTAMRLAHRIRLHAADQFDAQGLPLDPSLMEQRKRVFWIAFILDKDISLRTQQPPVQDDLDINLDLPNEDPVDGGGILYDADGSQKINFFRLRVHLAIIQGRIYQKVQSVAAAKQTREYRLQVARDLEKELEDWSDQLPSDFQLERVAEVCNFNGPALIHISILHATYLHALTMLNCICPLDKLWIGKVSKFITGASETAQQERDSFTAELPLSWSKCIKTSRLTLQLLSRIPQGDFVITW
jgi:hypothetical protein